MSNILVPSDPQRFGLRGIASGIHGFQRWKPEELGPVKEIPTGKVSMRGRFKLEVRRHGQLIREQEFDNLILNQGLEYLGTGLAGNEICAYCHIGTGTAVPSPTQTALGGFVASSAQRDTTINTPIVRAGPPTYAVTTSARYAFAQGAVVGNMSEVGTSKQNTNGGLFSRALITDSGGNPTTITLSSIDQLTVTYSITYYPTTTSQAGSVTLAGTSYNFTIYPTALNSLMYVPSSNAFLTPYSAFPFFGLCNGNTSYYACFVAAAGTPLSPTVATDASIPNAISLSGYSSFNNGTDGTVLTSCAYTSGSYLNTSTMTLPIASANKTGGIQCMQICMQGRGSDSTGTGGIQSLIYFSTPVPKTNTQTLSFTFQTSWGV